MEVDADGAVSWTVNKLDLAELSEHDPARYDSLLSEAAAHMPRRFKDRFTPEKMEELRRQYCWEVTEEALKAHGYRKVGER